MQAGLLYQGFDQDALRLFEVMSPKPDGRRKAIISRTIQALKQAGIWNTLDLLYLFAAHTSQAANLNWKAPNSNTCTLVNSPTFLADRYYQGDAATSYVNTNTAPSSLVQMTQNSVFMGVWCQNTLAAASKSVFGSTGATNANGLTMAPRLATNIYSFRANQTTATTSLTTTNTIGHLTSQRTAAGAVQAFINGASLGTDTSASNGISTQSIYVGAMNANGTASQFSDHQLSAFHVGSSLSAGQVLVFYQILRQYLAALGNAV